MRIKALRVAALIAVPLAVLIALLVRMPFGHKLELKAYFSDAMNLRPGARVRLAGVDVGSVKAVDVRPEHKEAPAEVVMVLNPSYQLKIPQDSIATVETAGVLGEAYVSIDVAHALGPPVAAGGVLKTIPATQINFQEIIERFGDILKLNCNCDTGPKIKAPPAKKGDTRHASPSH